MSSIRILTASTVDNILSKLSPESALSSQAHVFKHFSKPSPKPKKQQYDLIQTPHRITVNSEETTMLFMPARAPTISNSTFESSTTTSIKIVSLPQKSNDGLPGTTLILDEKNGKVKAIVNAKKLTALRNACGSALFLQQFPNPTPPKHLILFGSGEQCNSHTILFLKLWPSIEKVTFIIRSETIRSNSLITNLSNQFPNVEIKSSIHSSSDSKGLNELIKQGDIIITATPSNEPLFKSNDEIPKKGTRLILIGSYKPTMHEIDTALIKKSSIIVDSKDACLIESGELIDAKIEKEDLIELGEVLNEEGQNNDKKKIVLDKVGGEEGIIIFKSVGLGIQDVAITKLVLEEAERLNLGSIVENYD
ncbi:uncharacterized protein I206_100816 [Kwoniella pini CBS 10737]|uniref:Ornithine cyclodeaminase n=1 Tax=Kwoniella pini CBS 10737 TaxID=1296096 RepID=A0A1B9ICY6_9TREE|nr:uncharacterized protein I206_00511 [Kwoniella pini CBS 10737]OCF53210.1 hypothetical protein I206_00511 [Kwoniella pini CBS 10737]